MIQLNYVDLGNRNHNKEFDMKFRLVSHVKDESTCFIEIKAFTVTSFV